jgi:hypothetical protein
MSVCHLLPIADLTDLSTGGFCSRTRFAGLAGKPVRVFVIWEAGAANRVVLSFHCDPSSRLFQPAIDRERNIRLDSGGAAPGTSH